MKKLAAMDLAHLKVLTGTRIRQDKLTSRSVSLTDVLVDTVIGEQVPVQLNENKMERVDLLAGPLGERLCLPDRR